MKTERELNRVSSGYWHKLHVAGIVLLRAFVLTFIAYVGLFSSGCSVSREIIELQPAADQTPLQELESNLNYQDPDAGKPDYVRVEEQ